MAEAGDNTPPPARPANPLRARARLLALATQIGSVIFAVLVALAIDEWWEDREDAELGRRGLTAITAEVRSNLEEIHEDSARIADMLVSIDSALARLQAGDSAMSVNIDYPVALLSSAAWQSAQVTRAVNFIEIERVIRIARVYDVQLFFQRNQERLTDMIADIASTVDNDPGRVIGDIRRRYHLVNGFRAGLVLSYRCLLHELEPIGPPPPACEGEEGA